MRLSELEIDVYPNSNAETRLVNIKYIDDYSIVDTYIGHPRNCPPELQPSSLRNPYSVSEYGRKPAIEMYKAYLFHRYITDTEFRDTVHACTGDVIGAWNYPKRCHGEVLVDLIMEIDDSVDGVEVLSYISEELSALDVRLLDIEGLKFKEEAEERIADIV